MNSSNRNKGREEPLVYIPSRADGIGVFGGMKQNRREHNSYHNAQGRRSGMMIDQAKKKGYE